MALNPAWYSFPIKVERRTSTRTNRRETVAWEELHSALLCAVAGTYNKTDSTMLGGIPVEEYWLTIREVDLNGGEWPENNDRITMSGSTYYVTSVSDQTMNAAFFTLPKHKIVKIGKQPLTPLD